MILKMPEVSIASGQYEPVGTKASILFGEGYWPESAKCLEKSIAQPFCDKQIRLGRFLVALEAHQGPQSIYRLSAPSIGTASIRVVTYFEKSKGGICAFLDQG